MPLRVPMTDVPVSLVPGGLTSRRLKDDGGKVWLWLALLLGGLTVAGAVMLRAFRIDAGRIGSYLGILILAVAFVALLTGIASRIGWGSALAAAALVMGIGGGAEILNLYGAWPFGRYEYTDWWLPYVTLPNGKLFPLLLPVTWFLVVAVCYLVLARRLRGWPLIIGTALLAALVDLAMEPVITRVVLLWHWREPTPLLGAPYLNFLGWFIVAGLAACCLQSLRVWRAHQLPHPIWMFPAGLCFTAVIGVSYGEGRGAVALALLPLLFWVQRRA